MMKTPDLLCLTVSIYIVWLKSQKNLAKTNQMMAVYTLVGVHVAQKQMGVIIVAKLFLSQAFWDDGDDDESKWYESINEGSVTVYCDKESVRNEKCITTQEHLQIGLLFRTSTKWNKSNAKLANQI